MAKNKSPPYDFENFDDFRFSLFRGFQKYQDCKWSLIFDLNQILATVNSNTHKNDIARTKLKKSQHKKQLLGPCCYARGQKI